MHRFAQGLTYTALSRAKRFEQMAFDPAPSLGRLNSFMATDKFKARLREEKRLKKLAEETKRKYL